jgi:MFS transporter, DHA2 family, glioxin efflux transporter
LISSFYINLPVGGVSIFSILFFFKTPAGAKPVDVPLREKLLQMDLVGTFTIVAALVCFLLAMQWGGLTKAWNSSEVVGTLVGFVVLTIVFVTVEVFQGERALMVPRLLMTRAIASYCAFIFL